MIVLLALIIILLLGSLIGTVYLLGFRLGGTTWQAEAARIRGEATSAAADRVVDETGLRGEGRGGGAPPLVVSSGDKMVLERFLVGCLMLLAAAVALHLAWQLLRPLLPVVAVLITIVRITMLVARRRSYW